jgi:hypothetical protein
MSLSCYSWLNQLQEYLEIINSKWNIYKKLAKIEAHFQRKCPFQHILECPSQFNLNILLHETKDWKP